jgi:hypothetical protein
MLCARKNTPWTCLLAAVPVFWRAKSLCKSCGKGADSSGKSVEVALDFREAFP